MTRRDKILGHVNIRRGVGLEIGPLISPLVSKQDGAVSYLDFHAAAELKLRYANHLGIDVEKIVELDFATGGRSILETVGQEMRFDYVVASHVIEHVPNLIGWLNDIACVLNTGGRLALAIPDKRFMFDFNREATRFRELLDPYFFDYRRPSPAQQFDYLSQTTGMIPPQPIWSGEFDRSAFPPVHGPDAAMSIVRDTWRAQDYGDAHCAAFTDASFLDILASLMRHDLIGFRLVHFEPTGWGDSEFFATLEKLPPGLDPARRRASMLDSLADAQVAVSLAPPPQVNLERAGGKRPASLESNPQSLQAQIELLQARLAEITRSRSWRLTAPIRRIAGWIRKRLRRGGPGAASSL